MLLGSRRRYWGQGDDRLTELSLDEVVRRLTEEYGYPPEGARMVADKLMGCSPQVWAAFGVWWESGDVGDLEIEGYTVQRLAAEHGMKPIAAFLTLDWLVREPQRALTSLRRGHDRVQ